MEKPVGFRLDGMVAMVTGAGRGIGKAIAVALATHGASVVITEVPGRSNAAEAVLSTLRASGHEAMAATLDVTASLMVEDVVETAVEQYGRLDVLVNNAGIQILKPAFEIEENEFDAVLAVNLKGAFLCSRAAARVMTSNGGGSIINVASQHGVVGNRHRAPYSASKGGLISLTRALAVEWAPYKIRVNSISPTFVETEENRPLFDSHDLKAEIATGVLFGRPATPAEVAMGVVYLASSAAQMITGHNLMIDGGWTAH